MTTETGVPDNITFASWNAGSAVNFADVYQIIFRANRYRRWNGAVYEAGSPGFSVLVYHEDLTNWLEIQDDTGATNQATGTLIFQYTRKVGVERKITVSDLFIAGSASATFGNRGGVADRGKDNIHLSTFEMKFDDADDTPGNHIAIANA